jgi:hypothetical protein
LFLEAAIDGFLGQNGFLPFVELRVADRPPATSKRASA